MVSDWSYLPTEILEQIILKTGFAPGVPQLDRGYAAESMLVNKQWFYVHQSIAYSTVEINFDHQIMGEPLKILCNHLINLGLQ
jgi:hypothetical protein